MHVANARRLNALLFALGAHLLGCAHSTAPVQPTPPASSASSVTPGVAGPIALPAQLQGKAVVLADTDADHARGDLAGAVKAPGEGGLTEGLVVRLTADIPVYRMWSGPEKKDSRGNTNRLGQWWAYDAPTGTQASYRAAYEICGGWNDLTWVVKCTLKAGAVVTIGPGQSVSAATCGDASGQESYPANPEDWQVFVAKAWTRLGPDKELDCPDEAMDYQADLTNIASPLVAKAAE